MIQDKPKISVVTASKNGARFLRETIESILRQNFTDYEHIVVDSASTDDTLKILEEYEHIRWVSEPDESADEGFYKAMMMARGEYIMICCVSDGYVDKDWFGKCVEILDNNPDVSLVWGMPQNIKEDGTPGKVVFSNYSKTPPPQKSDFFPLWLGTFFVLPENTFCVRADVYKKCFPNFEPSGYFLQNHALFSFNYNFNVNGYLPYFLPVVASFGRSHHDSVSRKLVELNRTMKKQYFAAVDQYRNDLLSGKIRHYFRDGDSNIIGSISSDELKSYCKKILYYQLNSRAYLGKKKKIGLNHQIKKLRILINYYLNKRY
jgi:glycosyltransferase involved in cell wall biosynthesis